MAVLSPLSQMVHLILQSRGVCVFTTQQTIQNFKFGLERLRAQFGKDYRENFKVLKV